MLGDLFGLEFVGKKRGSQGIMDAAPESHTKEFKFHSDDNGVSTSSPKQNVSLRCW